MKANIAEQLFSPNLSAQIKGDFDAMLMKVKDLDAQAFEKTQVGAVNLDR